MKKEIITYFSILFLITFLYFDYPTISKIKKNFLSNFSVSNSRVNLKKKENNVIAKRDERSYLFWIILGIVIFFILVLGTIIYFVFFAEDFNKYQCGLCIEGDKIEVILCLHWDKKIFFDQLWKLEVENKKEKQVIYQEMEKNKEQIRDFFNSLVELLNLINVSFLKDIRYLVSKKNDIILPEMVQKIRNINNQNLILFSSGIFVSQILSLNRNDFLLFQDLEKKKSLSFFKRVITYPYKVSDHDNDIFFGYFYVLWKKIFFLIIRELHNLFKRSSKYNKLKKNFNNILTKINNTGIIVDKDFCLS